MMRRDRRNIRLLLRSLQVLCGLWVALWGVAAFGVLFVTHDAGRYSPLAERMVVCVVFLAIASPLAIGAIVLHRMLERRSRHEP